MYIYVSIHIHTQIFVVFHYTTQKHLIKLDLAIGFKVGKQRQTRLYALKTNAGCFCSPAHFTRKKTGLLPKYGKTAKRSQRCACELTTISGQMAD